MLLGSLRKSSGNLVEQFKFQVTNSMQTYGGKLYGVDHSHVIVVAAGRLIVPVVGPLATSMWRRFAVGPSSSSSSWAPRHFCGRPHTAVEVSSHSCRLDCRSHGYCGRASVAAVVIVVGPSQGHGPRLHAAAGLHAWSSTRATQPALY